METNTIQEEEVSDNSGELNEEELRRYEELCGKWIKLGDGQEWCIPAMPLGKRGDAVYNALCEIWIAQEEARKYLDLEKNDQEQKKRSAQEELEYSREKLQHQIDAGNKCRLAMTDFAHKLLKVNYPRLTRDQFDRHMLVSLGHINTFMSVAQGTQEIMDILGNLQNGENLRGLFQKKGSQQPQKKNDLLPSGSAAG